MTPRATAAAAPAIRVRHLSHRYGNREVLHDVTFEVAKGEIFGFIGPNGAGKTTTIRILATLVPPLAGRVEVGGYDVALAPEHVRRILGYMPDHAGVYERLSVDEYLACFAAAYHVARPSRVDEVLEITALGWLRDRLVATLSKGMKQRLQLARVLLHDPSILVLDEPASDLDPRARIEMRALLMELRRSGKTIFLSSHILTELADLCSSVAILEAGRLVVAGPVHEMARRLGEQPALGLSVPSLASAAASPPADRCVRLRVLGDTALLLRVLTGGPGIRRTDVLPGGHVTVTYQGDDHWLAGLVQHLVSQGVALVGVEPEQTELERVFLEATTAARPGRSP